MELEAGSLYEANKQLMMQEKPLDVIALNIKIVELAKWLEDLDYTMLLCRERNDYTVFNNLNLNLNTSEKLESDLRETLTNRGTVVSIDKQKDGNYEIWIKDEIENDVFCYYLFNYEFGVVQY